MLFDLNSSKQDFIYARTVQQFGPHEDQVLNEDIYARTARGGWVVCIQRRKMKRGIWREKYSDQYGDP